MVNNATMSTEYYDKVFLKFSIILRVVHRELNFGHISVVVERRKFNIRWTVRKKNEKKFTYNIPISFESIGSDEISNDELFAIAQDLVKTALITIPKHLIRINNE
jgi:hypothetical protein